MGRLGVSHRRYLADMLLSFLKGDYHRAAVVHLEAGYVPLDTNISAFEDALREVAVPIFNRPLADISIAELLLCMFAVTERFQMETQPELLLLQKTMVVIEGVARELADDVNIWELAKPLVGDWVLQHMGPKAKLGYAAEDLKGHLNAWMTLPERMDTMIEHVKQSKLMEPPKPSVLPLLMGVLLSAAGVAVLFGESLHVPHWHLLLGSGLLVFGSILIVQRKN